MRASIEPKVLLLTVLALVLLILVPYVFVFSSIPSTS